MSHITYLPKTVFLSSSITDIKEYLINNPIPENHVAMFSFAEKNCVDVIHLINEINALDVDFFGGIFPSLIYGAKKFDEGVLINILPAVNKPYLITDLDKEVIDFPCFNSLPIYESNMSGIVLIDGLTANIGSFLSELYDCFGNEINLIGGGAGSLSLEQKPCLFNNDGFFQDAAIICPIEMNCNVGVKHGWEMLDGPFVATKTEKNIIKELNWRPAFDVYKEVVENDSNQTFTVDNFLDIAKTYPFGMSRGNSEVIVRDPIVVNEKGELVCVGEVSENSVLDILKGENQRLIDAARDISTYCDIASVEVNKVMVFDCISRSLFLKDAFEEELSEIQKEISNYSNEKMSGVLTLGEIASNGKGGPEFYNKTIVLGILYD